MDDEDKKALGKYATRSFSYSSKNVEALDIERSLEMVEKLLRDLDVCSVWFDTDGTTSLQYWVGEGEEEHWADVNGASLAEAHKKLKEGVRG